MDEGAGEEEEEKEGALPPPLVGEKDAEPESGVVTPIAASEDVELGPEAGPELEAGVITPIAASEAVVLGPEPVLGSEPGPKPGPDPGTVEKDLGNVPLGDGDEKPVGTEQDQPVPGETVRVLTDDELELARQANAQHRLELQASQSDVKLQIDKAS